MLNERHESVHSKQTVRHLRSVAGAALMLTMAMLSACRASPVDEDSGITEPPSVWAHVRGHVFTTDGEPRVLDMAEIQWFVFQIDCETPILGPGALGPTNAQGLFAGDLAVPRMPEGTGCIRVWIPAEVSGTEEDVEVFVPDIEFVFFDPFGAPKDTAFVELVY